MHVSTRALFCVGTRWLFKWREKGRCGEGVFSGGDCLCACSARRVVILIFGGRVFFNGINEEDGESIVYSLFDSISYFVFY